MKFGEAPVFYWLYTLLIVAGGAFVLLIPGQQLVKIVLWSQVLNGVVLPFVLVFMLLLINKKELMGEYVNSRLFNVVAWTTTILVTALSVALAVAMIAGKTGLAWPSDSQWPQLSRMIRAVFPQQVPDQHQIRFQKIKLRKILGIGPLNIFKNPVLNFFLVLAHHEEAQLHHSAIRILVLESA